MGLLAPLAALLGLEAGNLVSHAKSTALIYGLIALFSFAAAAFLVAAGYMALADIFGAIVAALILAGVFLLLALAVYLGSMIGRGRHQRDLAEKRRASEKGALISTAAITALPLLARTPGLLRLGLPAVAIAAFLLLRDSKDE